MDTAGSQLETARKDCGNLIELNFVLVGQTVFDSIYGPLEQCRTIWSLLGLCVVCPACRFRIDCAMDVDL
jgi:hypothetical protein